MARRREIGTDEVLQLWLRYSAFQRHQVAQSTNQRDYNKIAMRLVAMPDLPNAVAIRDWLLENYAAETTRRTLQQLNACCRWAVESDFIDRNPFAGFTKQIRRKQSPTTWTAFTVEERDAIILAFEQAKPFYAPWVKFLFHTGCRPEEGAGLRWEHIKPDFSVIHFCGATPVDVAIDQETKTHRNQLFPCNPRLQALLQEMNQCGSDRSVRVFRGVKGGLFNYNNFETRHWIPTVKPLVEAGKVLQFLPEGHMRHTWITLALDAGMSVNDVAYLSGNSPHIIYRHYASKSRVSSVPEF